MPRYEHTQIGYVILGAAAIAGLVGLLLVLGLGGDEGDVGLWGTMAVLGVVAFLFHSLTVRVDDGELIWYFGPRFWRNSLPITSIERVEVVRNTIWHGWGIRMLRHGWLYNVSGLDAVEIETSGGDVVRIGTDEPDRLARVLEAVEASP